MSQDGDLFAEFLVSIRHGDDQAAANLVGEFESIIRREVRMRLLDPRLRRVLDSGDVCQSVLASFFVRAAAGQYELSDSRDLLQLLVSMARKKTAEASRRQYRQRRDARRQEALGEVDHPDVSAKSPSQLVACQELGRLMNEAFDDEERGISRLRREGHSWQQIAEQLGGTPDGRRMQLARAADRICTELGLYE